MGEQYLSRVIDAILCADAVAIWYNSGVGASGRPRNLTLFFDIGGDAPTGTTLSANFA